MIMDKEEQALKNAGCEDVKYYGLVNNYGYTFTIKGIRYDLRHELNCYGASINWWSLKARKDNEYIKLDKGTFDTFEQALDFIKSL